MIKYKLRMQEHYDALVKNHPDMSEEEKHAHYMAHLNVGGLVPDDDDSLHPRLEYNSQQEVTIPDDAWSLTELVERNRKGYLDELETGDAYDSPDAVEDDVLRDASGKVIGSIDKTDDDHFEGVDLGQASRWDIYEKEQFINRSREWIKKAAESEPPSSGRSGKGSEPVKKSGTNPPSPSGSEDRPKDEGEK